MKYPEISKPIKIGSVTVKNRMMMAPMDTGFGNHAWGGFTPEGVEYFVRRGIQRAIDKGIVTREEIFVTTKMWTSDYDDGEAAVQASHDRLGLDYINLMILHHSQPENDVQAYQAMEKAVSEGKLRSIGLSNYYEPEDFDRLVNTTSIKPALLQNETHPYHQSKEMQSHIAQYGTVLDKNERFADY